MPDKQPASEAAITNRLLAALLTRGIPMPEGAPLLANIGVSNSEIAILYGTTDATIRSAVSRGRRKEG